MAVLNYVTQFSARIRDMYGHELVSDALYHTNEDIQIIGAKEIKIPRLTVSGYKDHNRSTTSFNGGNYSNEFETKALDHDRDIEFAIDPMDVDETNQIVSVANIHVRFEKSRQSRNWIATLFKALFRGGKSRGNNKDHGDHAHQYSG